jgi:hypothetical protein
VVTSVGWSQLQDPCNNRLESGDSSTRQDTNETHHNLLRHNESFGDCQLWQAMMNLLASDSMWMMVALGASMHIFTCSPENDLNDAFGMHMFQAFGS